MPPRRILYAPAAAILMVAVAGCQEIAPESVTVAARKQAVELRSATRLPDEILRLAGLELNAGDRILNDGTAVSPDLPIEPDQPIHLQVVSQVPVLINGTPVLTAGSSVAQALDEQGFQLTVSDEIIPPADTPVEPGMIITYRASTAIELTADGTQMDIRESANSAEAALADAGVPAEGLDRVTAAGPEPPNGTRAAQLSRIVETLQLDQQAIPFQESVQNSPDVELGMQTVLQAGTLCLAVVRTRVRSEDGKPAGTEQEARTVVLPPVDRVVLSGSKIVERAETVAGVPITYWRALQMYATVYSPCNSGTADGSCSSGTASGRPAGKGVVAVDPDLYAFLNGQRLFIPGYGFAVVGDVGGGYIVEQNLGVSRYKWIDLGFDDGNVQDMTGWITVYFLSPPPATIPDALR